MISCLIGVTLLGHVFYHDSLGMIGIRVSDDGFVNKVHRHSPSSGLIYEKDKIISPSVGKLDGDPYTEVTIKVKRCNEVKEFTLKRVPREEIWD